METYSVTKSSTIPEFELVLKTKGVKSSELPKIGCSKDAADELRKVWSNKMEYIEEVVILMTNRGNKVTGWVKISQGGVAGTVMDPKVIFQHALNHNASGIIISHNHPSGNLIPSEQDKNITRRLKEAGKILEIDLLDHIIITEESFYSFADQGLL